MKLEILASGKEEQSKSRHNMNGVVGAYIQTGRDSLTFE
jgi:hypothetical protein